MSCETMAEQVQFAIHPVADHMPSQLNMPTSRKPVVFHMTFCGGKWKELHKMTLVIQMLLHWLLLVNERDILTESKGSLVIWHI